MSKKDIIDVTREYLLSLPKRRPSRQVGLFDSLIMIPQRKLHDSGYATICVVGCRNGSPVMILTERSDSINYIGRADWRMDCLPKSQLLHVFPATGQIKVGAACSTFDIEQVDRPEEVA